MNFDGQKILKAAEGLVVPESFKKLAGQAALDDLVKQAKWKTNSQQFRDHPIRGSVQQQAQDFFNSELAYLQTLSGEEIEKSANSAGAKIGRAFENARKGWQGKLLP